MADNCLAPAYAQVLYNSNGHDHVQRLPLKNVDAGMVNVHEKDGTSTALDGAILIYLNKLAAILDVTAVINGVEFYTQADCTSAPVFVRNYPIGAAIPGTEAAAVVPWTQIVMTFKTTLGGRFKLQIMEVPYAPDQKLPLGGGVDANVDAMTAYLLSASEIVAAYDGGFPSVQLNFVSKINDTLRKKYLNP